MRKESLVKLTLTRNIENKSDREKQRVPFLNILFEWRLGVIEKYYLELQTIEYYGEPGSSMFKRDYVHEKES